MPLVVDCCSLVHAKAMQRLELPPLSLLGQLAVRGARFVCTKAVLGELEASSLRSTLATWRREGLLDEAAPRMTERKEVLNNLLGRDAAPGKNDVGLVVVARRLRSPLLTHDAAAATLAQRSQVTVIDLVDVAAWADRAGVATLLDVSAAWGDLAGHPWPSPRDPWHGSVEATLAARPNLEAVLSRLMDGII